MYKYNKLKHLCCVCKLIKYWTYRYGLFLIGLKYVINSKYHQIILSKYKHTYKSNEGKNNKKLTWKCMHYVFHS